MATPTAITGRGSRSKRNLSRAKEQFGKSFYGFDDWDSLGADERNALMDALTYMVNSGEFYNPKAKRLVPKTGTNSPFPGWGVY